MVKRKNNKPRSWFLRVEQQLGELPEEIIKVILRINSQRGLVWDTYAIARATGINQRGLSIRFKASLKCELDLECTVKEYAAAFRAHQALKDLRDTGLEEMKISERRGFRHARAPMYRAIEKYEGLRREDIPRGSTLNPDVDREIIRSYSMDLQIA